MITVQVLQPFETNQVNEPDEVDWFDILVTDEKSGVTIEIAADLDVPPLHWELDKVWMPQHHWSAYKWARHIEDQALEVGGSLMSHFQQHSIDEIMNAPVTHWSWA